MLVTVALAQMDIQFGLPSANLARVRQVATTAVGQGATLLVLPELWATGYDLQHAHTLADLPGTGIFADLATLAREQQIAIAGSTLARRTDRPTNTATVYSADGHLLATYDKLHLFGLMHEDNYLAAGTALSVFDAPWGRSALAICYDLRFPELFRTYALRGAQLIIIPAEWPLPRLEHWRTLLRARAIENQCFVIGVNRVGTDPQNTFAGHSLVVDPWGEILVEGGTEPELLYATLDLSLTETIRARIPVFADRRTDIYGFRMD